MHGWANPSPDNAKDQFGHAVQRRLPAVNIDMLQRFPAPQCGEQAAQPQDMVQVAMGQQNGVQLPEAKPAAQDLPLRPLAAVDEKAILPIEQHLRGEAAMERRRGSGGTQENQFKHGCLLARFDPRPAR